MGCGASKSHIVGIEALEQQRDPEDYALEPIQLETTNIEEFDGVFANLCELLNRLIDLNNNVHQAVAEVKVAYAPIASGYELEVSFGPCHDVVLLDLQASKGAAARPEPEQIQKLLKDSAIASADADLEHARASLHEFLAGSPSHVAIKAARDGTLMVDDPAQEPSQVQHMNACLAKLRQALGQHCHLGVTVKPAAAFGTRTAKAQLYKKTQHGDTESKEPITVMDACGTLQAAGIKEAEAFFTDRTQHLAHRTKGLEDLDYEVVAGHQVALNTIIANEDVQMQVDKLLQAINIALFRMMNSGASARSLASLTNAVVEVVRPVFVALQSRHASSNLGYNLKTLISVKPAVEFRKEEDGEPPSFDFSFNVELQALADIPGFPDCLPEKAGNLLASIENLKVNISQALQDLQKISEEVDVLLEEAKEFYELCPEAAARRGLSMMEAVKCSKATGSNLRTLYNTQELFLAFGENVKRVADELAESPKEVNKLIDKMLVDQHH